MPGSSGSALTLSQVRHWDTGHLSEAAGLWSRVATLWEATFAELARQVDRPGASPWEGAAAESAQQRTYSDRLAVIGLADQLHSASEIARTGAVHLDAERRAVLSVVDAARAAGFAVADDFSISDPRVYDAVAAAARQASAEAFATDLRTALTTLLAVDAGVARKLTVATAGLGAATFAGPPLAPAEPAAPAQPADPPVPFRQCVEGSYRAGVGLNVVKDGFTSALTSAAAGAAGGGAVLPRGSKPVGVLGGAVVGFVGGFARGVAMSPAKTLAKAAVDCTGLLERR